VSRNQLFNDQWYQVGQCAPAYAQLLVGHQRGPLEHGFEFPAKIFWLLKSNTLLLNKIPLRIFLAARDLNSLGQCDHQGANVVGHNAECRVHAVNVLRVQSAAVHWLCGRELWGQVIGY
jgi:hypothetical protein